MYPFRWHDSSYKGVKDASFFLTQSHEELFCVSIENPRETVFDSQGERI